jgi:hypothetical protein
MIATKNTARHSRNQRNRRTNVAGVCLERQRRSLLQPKAGDNVACLGYFVFGCTTPTGLPIAHGAPASKATPLGLWPVFWLITRGNDVVATSGFNRKRRCRFDSRDCRNSRNRRDSHKKSLLAYGRLPGAYKRHDSSFCKIKFFKQTDRSAYGRSVYNRKHTTPFLCH